MSPSLVDGTQKGAGGPQLENLGISSIVAELARVAGIVHSSWLTDPNNFNKDLMLLKDFQRVAQQVVNSWVKASKRYETNTEARTELQSTEYKESVRLLETTIQVISTILVKLDASVGTKDQNRDPTLASDFFQVLLCTLPKLDITILESGVVNFKLMGVAWKAVLKVETTLFKLYSNLDVEQTAVFVALFDRLNAARIATEYAQDAKIAQECKVLCFFLTQLTNILKIIESSSCDTRFPSVLCDLLYQTLPQIFTLYNRDSQVIVSSLDPILTLLCQFLASVDVFSNDSSQTFFNRICIETNPRDCPTSGILRLQLKLLSCSKVESRINSEELRYETLKSIISNISSLPHTFWVNDIAARIILQAKQVINDLCSNLLLNGVNKIGPQTVELLASTVAGNHPILSELLVDVLTSVGDLDEPVLVAMLQGICTLADAVITLQCLQLHSTERHALQTRLDLFIGRFSRLTRDSPLHVKRNIVQGVSMWKCSSLTTSAVYNLLFSTKDTQLDNLNWDAVSIRTTMVLSKLMPAWWRGHTGDSVMPPLKIHHLAVLTQLLKTLNCLCSTAQDEQKQMLLNVTASVAECAQLVLTAKACSTAATSTPVVKTCFDSFSKACGALLTNIITASFPQTGAVVVGTDSTVWARATKENFSLHQDVAIRISTSLTVAAQLCSSFVPCKMILEALKLMDRSLATSLSPDIRGPAVFMTCYLFEAVGKVTRMSQLPEALPIAMCTLNTALDVAAFENAAGGRGFPIVLHLFGALELFALRDTFPLEDISNLLLEAHRIRFAAFLNRTTGNQSKGGGMRMWSDRTYGTDGVAALATNIREEGIQGEKIFSLKFDNLSSGNIFNDSSDAVVQVQGSQSTRPHVEQKLPNESQITDTALNVQSLLIELYNKVPETDVRNLQSADLLVKHRDVLHTFATRLSKEFACSSLGP